MVTVRVNSTGVEWVVNDDYIDAYWAGGSQWMVKMMISLYRFTMTSLS